MPSESNDKGGRIMFLTKTLTIALKEAPIMIPTAISIIFPFTAKSLKSFNSFIGFRFCQK